MASAVKVGQGAGLGDALLEDLARRALGVVQGQVGVDRHVVLAVGGVDLRLGDQRLEPEGAGLVRHDRRHERTDGRIAHEVAQQAGEHHGRGDRLGARSRRELLEHLGVGSQGRRRPHDPYRHRPVEHPPARPQVLHGVGSLGRPDVGRVSLERRVGDVVGQIQAVAQRAELRLGHLLDLVRGVARLDLGPERPALDRLGQDDRRRAPLLGGQLVGGVELAVVVPAPGQRDQLVVAEVLDHLAQPGVGAEEVLTDVRAGLDGQLLVLAVERRVHAVEEDAVDVLGQERIPPRAPDDLDDVPARTAEDRLELLDDLAVAADRTVEPLQVAVDDEDQVVEVLAARHAERADRLGLVHLAVADEAPHPAGAGVDETAQVEVAVDVRLVDGRDRAQAHRHGGELPEVGEQARVRVARQAVPADLVAEVVELGLGQPALDVGPGVDARRRVPLEEDLVAEATVGLAAEEMVEADLVERRRAGVGREVAADALGARVGPRHHGGRVPADVGADPALLVLVAGEPGFGVGRDGVDVGRRDGGGEVDLLGARPLQELHEQIARPGTSPRVDDGVEGVEPLLRLARIRVGNLVADPVEQHRSTVPGAARAA